MTSPAQPTTTRGPIGPERTRQQLQELDSLLQQMLALPIADQTEENAPTETAPASAPIPFRPAAIQQTGSSASTRPPTKPPGPDPLAAILDDAVARPRDAAPKRENGRPQSEDARSREREQEGSTVKRLAPLPTGSPPKRSSTLANVKAPTRLDLGERPPAAAERVIAPAKADEASMRPSTNGNSPILTLPARETKPLHTDIATFDLSGPAGLDVSPDDSLQGYGLSAMDAMPPARPSSFIYSVFAAINGIYDLLAALLGPLGSVLTAPKFRNALGWTGIVLVVAAAGLWLMSWFGWTW